MPDRGKLLAESTIAWWRDAGVDYLCNDEAKSWLSEDAEPVSAAPQNVTVSTAQIATAMPPVKVRPSNEWPTDFTGLMQAISSDAALPGNGYGRRIAAPHAAENAEVMVLLDFPEEAEIEAARLGGGTSGKLLFAMVKACGFDANMLHIGSLAHSRPASGALPAEEVALLAQFAWHQIGVVKPKRLLLAGGAVSEALANQDLISARANLQNLNHDGRNMAAVATYHPRTLLARPMLKAQAWQDLQGFLRKDHL